MWCRLSQFYIQHVFILIPKSFLNIFFLFVMTICFVCLGVFFSRLFLAKKSFVIRMIVYKKSWPWKNLLLNDVCQTHLHSGFFYMWFQRKTKTYTHTHTLVNSQIESIFNLSIENAWLCFVINVLGNDYYSSKWKWNNKGKK